MSLPEQRFMSAGDATNAARRWATEEAATLPGFAGAFIAGSTTWLPNDAPIESTSDVDVKVILDADERPEGPQKIPWCGVVLDISYASLDELRSAEAVLANYYTAGHFVRPGILLDPTGHLHAIQPTVAREYARRRWVRARAEHARDTAISISQRMVPAAPLHDRMYAWLLTICALPHAVLVADLRNPTIRKSLVAFNDVLEAYGHGWLHEQALGILGSDRMERKDVETLLTGCIEAFDEAQAVITTPFFGSSNISELGRPMAIGGIREMIDDGHHREATYWIGVIHTWCQTAIQNDAPTAVRNRFEQGYHALVGALGIESDDDLETRMEQTRALLPDVWRVTEEIIARNRDIVD